MNRNELIEKDNMIPIETIIEKHVDLHKSGTCFTGSCPFHHGKARSGSFKVVPGKNIWKCFKCGDGYGGNGIHFYQLYFGLSYLDAAYQLAYDYGIIDASEYQEYTKKGDIIRSHPAYSYKPHEKRPDPVRASDEVIHNVYGIMKSVLGLSKKHHDYLRDVRKLPEERIQADYFSGPSDWHAVNEVIRRIRSRYPEYDDEVLMTVPGFFYNRKGYLSFVRYHGIHILIRGADNKIRAVQIRREDDEIKEKEDGRKQSRYIWFSSYFAYNRPDQFIGGCGCGSPKDVLIPNVKSKWICITEGRFKSEILLQKGLTVISLQGVSSWRNIEKDIEELLKIYPYEKICFYFDSDILGNHNLFVQTVKLYDCLHDHFPDLTIVYAFWRKRYGKGIDDMIFAGNKKKQKIFSDIETLIRTVNEGFQEILKSYGIPSIRDLDEETMVRFQESLQIHLENKLCLK